MTTPAPSIQIDPEADTPVYRQVADAVRSHLVAGRLRPGDHLPTVRQLAMDLGVHHNTIAEAWRVLAEEGWVELGRRRGAVVLERERPELEGEELSRFNRRLEGLWAEAVSSGLSKAQLRKALLKFVERSGT